MAAVRRPAHGDAQRLAGVGIGVADIPAHQAVQLGPEQGRQRGVAIREPDRHPAGGEARQRPGAPHRVCMERGHVFEMVAVQQSLAVAGRHGAARMDAGRQQRRRAERGDAGFDIAHPADRVVEGRVEGGDRERRRIAEQHDRSPDARRLVGAVGQRHVGRRSSRSRG